jgi:hypothetical protein
MPPKEKTPPAGPSQSDFFNFSDIMQKQLDIQDAYQRAVNQLKFDRAQRQIRSGLTDKWAVDPKLQFGTYQALLQRQGQELDDSEMMAHERGLFGPGVGNQAERLIRYRQAVENLQFKNQLSDWEREYQLGMQDADRMRSMGEYEYAYPEYGEYPPGGGGGGGGGGQNPIKTDYPFYYNQLYKQGYATPYTPGNPVKDKYQHPGRRG